MHSSWNKSAKSKEGDRQTDRQMDRHLVSLPDYVVDVNSVALFKKWLDKFWADQNVMFDWTDNRNFIDRMLFRQAHSVSV